MSWLTPRIVGSSTYEATADALFHAEVTTGRDPI